jgi:glutamyl/glutaminyl-tRNA synthetase
MVAHSTRSPYRGRLAPSPTGFLHLGHAATFWTAFQRARAAGGSLILRNEDLDAGRCRPEFVEAMLEDLRWFGIDWDEGPDVGGPHAPYHQSERFNRHLEAWQKLQAGGFIYPCSCSRKDILQAAGAPHAGEEEPLYPGICRPGTAPPPPANERAGRSWRFRVPEGEAVTFEDRREGRQTFVAGRDFGDFVVWRKEDLPAYQLAVVVDDAAMGVTEVVRGTDLLLSTARQLLLFRALHSPAPDFYHCPLILDENGQRLAKRHEALSLRALRAAGRTPEELRRQLRL